MRAWWVAIPAALVAASGGCTGDDEIYGARPSADAGAAPVVDPGPPVTYALEPATIRRGQSARVRVKVESTGLGPLPLPRSPRVGTRLFFRAPEDLGLRAGPLLVESSSVDDELFIEIDAVRDGPTGSFPVELGAEDPQTQLTTWRPASVMLEVARGTLDPAFGTAGRSVLPGLPPVEAMSCRASTRVRVAGVRDGALVVGQLLHDGSLDPAFGTAGVATIAIAGARGPVRLAGDLLAVGGSALHVVRLLEDGTPDPAWAATGVATVALRDDVVALLLRSDGILTDTRQVACAATKALSPGTEALACASLTASGELDTTFATGGIGVLDAQVVGIASFDWTSAWRSGPSLTASFAGLSIQRELVDGAVDFTPNGAVVRGLERRAADGPPEAVVSVSPGGFYYHGQGIFRTASSFGVWRPSTKEPASTAPVPAGFEAVVVREVGGFTLAGHVVTGMRRRAALGFFGGLDGLEAKRTSWMVLPDANVDETFAAIAHCGELAYAAGASGDGALVVRTLP